VKNFRVSALISSNKIKKKETFHPSISHLLKLKVRSPLNSALYNYKGGKQKKHIFHFLSTVSNTPIGNPLL
jgi:hypothetical protein